MMRRVTLWLAIMVIASSCVATPRPDMQTEPVPKPDVVFNSPEKSYWDKANTLHIINITSEPSGAWVVISNDRVGRTPLQVGIYGTNNRAFFRSIDIEVQPTQEMEGSLPPQGFFSNLYEGKKHFFGSDLGGGDRIPINLHLKLNILDREKVKEFYKNQININVN